MHLSLPCGSLVSRGCFKQIRRLPQSVAAACIPAIPSTHQDGHQNGSEVQIYLQTRLSLFVDKDVDLSSLSVQRDLEPNIGLLLSIQSHQRVAGLLKSHPELLGVPLEAWQAFLSEYGISQHFFFKLLSANAQLFIQGSLFTAGQNMLYLQSLGLSTRDISAHVIPRAAEVLTCHFATTMMPVVNFLTAPLAPPCTTAFPEPTQGTGNSDNAQQQHQRSEAQEGNSGLQALINMHEPGSEAGDSRSAVQYGLGLSQEQLRSLISRCPRVLLMSVEEDLQPRLQYLTHDLKLTGEQARTMIDLNSCLLIQPIKPLLEVHVNFLEEVCGFSPQEARSLLVTCPDLIVFSTGNLSRKWQYISRTVFGAATAAVSSAFIPTSASGPTQEEGLQGAQQAGSAATDAASQARAAVLGYPHSLSRSLLNDIGPRFSYARDRSLLHHLLEYNTQAQSVLLSLRKLLDSDTVSFVSLVNGDESDFQQYCRQWRRNEAGKLTLTSSSLSESSW